MGSRENARYIDEKAAEAHLNVGNGTGRTLRNWRVRGGGPPYRKFGHYVRYELHELDRWAESQRRTSTSETACKTDAA